MLQSATEYYRVPQSITEYYRVLQSVTEYYRVLQSIAECYRVLKSISSASTWTNFWACWTENTISWWTFSIFGNTSFHYSFSQVCSLTVAKRIEMGNNLGLSTTTLYKAWCQLKKDIVFMVGVFDTLSDSIFEFNKIFIQLENQGVEHHYLIALGRMVLIGSHKYEWVPLVPRTP